MSPRAASAIVWGLSAVVTGLLAYGFVLPSAEDADAFLLLIIVPFLVVGALVAMQRPENPVGWLFLGFSAVATIAFTAGRYWVSGPDGPGSRPGAALVASLGVHLWHPGFALFILSFLLFPNGRPLSRRWVIAAWVTGVLGVVGVASGMLEHAFYEDFFGGDVLPAPLLTGPVAEFAAVVFGVCLFGILGMLVVAAACIFLRFLRSTGVERQQMSWVVLAIMVFASALPASLLLLDEAAGVWLLPLIPIAAGIAILRHGLFDIDFIVNRALVYGLLTVMLTAVYFAGVLGLGAVVQSVSNEEGTTLAVAASTLAVAGLFVPLRHRVQRLIDRRFYRSKYDAEQVVAMFSARLRDQVELASLNTELLDAVHRTVLPSGVSIWLRRRK